MTPLEPLRSIKTKLGALVAASVAVATAVSLVGAAAGVPWLLVLPVTVGLSLGVTQLLAAGMVAPLRQMTEASRRMARGDYSGRVEGQSADEVGLLAAAFNQMAADLEEVDREQRELIAMVSHELRTPLTAMTAMLENLADGVVPADSRNLSLALTQAERLRDLVADLLTLSRLEAGIVTLDLAQVPVGALVADCAEQVRLSGRSARIVTEVPDDLVFRGDAVRLRQLVLNLLDNASRHSPPDAPVVVRAGRGQDTDWLEVLDSGEGVAPPHRERAFDRFDTQGVGGGTGLGLAIARWVATLHGGTLRFEEPDEPRGARLRLTLPLPGNEPDRAAPTPDHGPKEALVATTTHQPSPPPTPPSSPTAAPATASGMDALFGRYWPEDRRVPRLATAPRVVVGVALAAVVAAVVMPFTGMGLGMTVTLLISGVAATVAARHRRTPWFWACAGIAAALVLVPTLRAAGWLGFISCFVAAGVFLGGTTAARTLAGMVLSGVSWPLSSLRGLPWFGRSLVGTRWGAGAAPVVRTVMYSLLALAVFGALFASADAVFASWMDAVVPSFSFSSTVARVFVGCGVFAMTLAGAYLALNPPRVDAFSERTPSRLSNRFEWLVPVLVVDGVFVLFLGAQAAAVFGGHGYIERTTGLTYAQYVHQGFGQLTLATALTLVVVWAASRRAGTQRSDQMWLKASLGLLCLLTLVVVASALHRMHLYQEAYGFTTLRLFVDVFEGWLGLVVVAVMVLGGLGRGRHLARVALVTGSVAILGLAALNPEAWVAQRNIDRYEQTGNLDMGYLRSLSADSVHPLADRLPDDVAACILVVHEDGSMESALEDPRAWNLGRTRAAEVLDSIDLPASDRDLLSPRCEAVWAELNG